MKFTLKKPCKNCPFSVDSLEGWLGAERADDIARNITDGDGVFTCHKTGKSKDDEPQHCAGALILLEKLERPNQLMRIAERMGEYDHTRLHMDEDIFDTLEEFIDHHA